MVWGNVTTNQHLKNLGSQLLIEPEHGGYRSRICQPSCLKQDVVKLAWTMTWSTWVLFGMLNMIPILNIEHDSYLERWTWFLFAMLHMIPNWNNRRFLASFLHEILNGSNAVVLHRAAETSIPDKWWRSEAKQTQCPLYCVKSLRNTWVQAIHCKSLPLLWRPCFSHQRSHFLQTKRKCWG